MSGYFNYEQNSFDNLIEELQRLCESDLYSNSILEEFYKALTRARELKILIDRIDLLASGDESEEEFHEGLLDDMEYLDYSDISELDFEF